jgi:isoleucyl-tRNA synthetase
MAAVRELASVGLKLREQAGIKVRQPLASLTAANIPASEELRAILRDELNVKELHEDTQAVIPALDTELTPELKEEGQYREWVRTIQDWRKAEGLSIEDRPGLLVTAPDTVVLKKFRDALRDATGLLSLEVREGDGQKLERL